MASCLFSSFASYSLYCQHCIISTHCIVTSYISYPTLESCSREGGGGVLHTPLFLVFRRFPDSTQLWGSLPAPPPLFAGSFLLFISSNSDFSNRVTHAASLSLQLSFGVTGRESPTVGPGHSSQLNPLHLGSITPTLPISLRESLSFGEIWLYCDLMKYFAIIYRLLDESIAPPISVKIF